MFDYFISLGSACPIASSMSQYGLRSFSGPFDWLITADFSWVLHYIETGFEDFLLRDNLERYDDYENHFRDKQSDFKFIHDLENFEREYDKLKDKYDRRICRFLEKVNFKVCYLRSLHSLEDLEYVRTHAVYIKSIIQKYNKKSEIVFLCSDNLSIPEHFEFRYFLMPGIWSGESRAALRSFFDCADDFLAFCGNNYSAASLLKNLAVDLEKEKAQGLALLDRRYRTLTALLSHDFSKDMMSSKTIIYGAGAIGKALYGKIKLLTSVAYFVDKEKAGGEFEGIRIVSIDEIQYREETKVIVSAAYDFENIKKELMDKFQDRNIVSLDDILGLKF